MTTDIDSEVTAIAARKNAALVFKSAPDKPKVKATLTPVGTERKATIPDIPEVFLTKEAVGDIARDLRVQAATLIAVADGLDKYNEPSDEPAPRKLSAIEKRMVGTEPAVPLTDAESFAIDYAAKQAAAQAATYKAPEVDLVAEATRIFAGNIVNPMEEVAKSQLPSGWTDWVCPKHGDANVRNIKAKSGRKYRACEHCEQYEK